MPTTNVPRLLSTFIGRSREVAELDKLLDDNACRLLTLVGPGGIGKTRLAIEVVKDRGGFSDGIWIVDLQPINSIDRIVVAIAEEIEFSFQGAEVPTQQLLSYLTDKDMLLLLDNFEQLLHANGADLLVDILQATTEIKLIVTSREALNLQSEWLYPVYGLSVPTSDERDRADQFSAIELFIQQAQRVNQSFSLADEQNCVIHICEMVEGMPLAIQMAASWLSTLPCADVATRIERGLLDAKLRDTPERHRSIQNVFEQSWALLDDHERHIFKQLSVFSGGFRREAAEQVMGASMLMLSALADKSLVQLDAAGRYRMHELARQFAQQKLNEMAELRETTLDRHCGYYTEYLQQREYEFRTQHSPAVMLDMAEEIGNVREAWQRAVERGKIEQIHQAVRCLTEYYDYRQWYQEGAQALEGAVEALRPAQPEDTTRGIALGLALAGQGNLLHNLGQIERAGLILREAVAVLRPLKGMEELAHALGHLNRLLVAVAQFKEAEKSYQECVTLAREASDVVTQAYALINLGIITGVLGKYREAKQHLQAALAHLQGIRHRLGAGISLSLLGELAYTLGDYQQARQLLEEASAIQTDLDSRWHMSLSYRLLAQVAHAIGDYNKAEEYLQSSLTIAYEVGDPRVIAFALINSGDLFVTLEEFEQAQQHYHRALVIAQEGSHRWQEAMSLLGLGRAAYGLRDDTLSHNYLHDSLVLCREIGWQLGVAHTLNGLGYVAMRLGDNTQAQRHFHEALQTGVAIGVMPVILETLVGIAQLSAIQGKLVQATELLTLNLRHPACHAATRTLAGQLLNDLENRIPQEVFAAAQQRSQANEIETIVNAQLLELSTPEIKALLPGNHTLLDPLSRRELEVLELIVAGYTNREIAGRLHISVNTVKKHINHIFSKLDVTNRIQAITQARHLNILP